jgi:putative ABC transport system permease protein
LTLGGFALALATIGMFGVFAYAVRQRTREIGVRMALGAQPSAIVRLVVGGHTRAVIVGLAAGAFGALAASMVLRSRLHGVSPFDPIAYLEVAAILAAAGLAASYLPARHAVRVDPVIALRWE